MEDADFSDEFCKFLQARVPSVEAAEQLVQAWRDGAGASDDATRAHLATLAQAYEERPVTLFRIIYALRDSKIRSFADAFKVRKR